MSDPDHAHFAEWDAAYVLGALSPSDRKAFEAHLEECALCRAAVAEVVPVVGLLSRVDAERARSMRDDPATAPIRPEPALRDALVRRGAAARRRRRLRWGVLALAAVVVVAAAIAVPLSLSRPLEHVQTVAMEDVAGVPLEATIGLDQVGWGTRIDLDCAYGGGGSGAPEEGWPYVLVVTGADGAASVVSSWRAKPDTTARLSAGTALDVADIRSIEIQSMATGAVLMRAEIGRPR
jgi:hypothetical protein